MLNWRMLPLKYRDDAFVKGTELDVCYPDGFRHRFAIYSVRCLGWGTDSYGKPVREYDVFYRVRDAEAAGDAHYREGKRAPIFGEFATLDEALTAIEPHRPIQQDA